MRLKRRLPPQLSVALAIIVIGGGALGAEYWIVKWYPVYRQHVADTTLKMLPYRCDALGVELQVAAGIYGKVENVAGGVRIYRPKLFVGDPALTIIAQPNPDRATEFSPQLMAQWEAQGANESIPRYSFEHAKINSRDAAVIWQWKDRAMLMTAHVISPDRILQADCTPGGEDESLYLEACEASLRSLKLEGPLPAQPGKPTLENAGTSP